MKLNFLQNPGAHPFQGGVDLAPIVVETGGTQIQTVAGPLTTGNYLSALQMNPEFGLPHLPILTTDHRALTSRPAIEINYNKFTASMRPFFDQAAEMVTAQPHLKAHPLRATQTATGDFWRMKPAFDAQDQPALGEDKDYEALTFANTDGRVIKMIWNRRDTQEWNKYAEKTSHPYQFTLSIGYEREGLAIAQTVVFEENGARHVRYGLDFADLTLAARCFAHPLNANAPGWAGFPEAELAAYLSSALFAEGQYTRDQVGQLFLRTTKRPTSFGLRLKPDGSYGVPDPRDTGPYEYIVAGNKAANNQPVVRMEINQKPERAFGLTLRQPKDQAGSPFPLRGLFLQGWIEAVRRGGFVT